MSHLASRLGIRENQAFQDAYWKTFQSFFGPQNAPMVRATLLARVGEADTGAGELDRVCYGLRQTMAWAAEAIEKRALDAVGQSDGAGLPQAKENRATT